VGPHEIAFQLPEETNAHSPVSPNAAPLCVLSIPINFAFVIERLSSKKGCSSLICNASSLYALDVGIIVLDRYEGSSNQ
jgi:hypothetical protein